MQQAMGIQSSSADPNNPIPAGLRHRALSRRIRHRTASWSWWETTARTMPFRSIFPACNSSPRAARAAQAVISLPFNADQTGPGPERVDRRGRLRLAGHTAVGQHHRVLQATTSSYTEYRWFADCGSNNSGLRRRTSPWARGWSVRRHRATSSPPPTSTVSIDRGNEPSVNPMQFQLDFSNFPAWPPARPAWRSPRRTAPRRERCPVTRSARTASSAACSATASPATWDKSRWPTSQPGRPGTTRAKHVHCRRQLRPAGDRRARLERHRHDRGRGHWNCPTPTWARTSST